MSKATRLLLAWICLFLAPAVGWELALQPRSGGSAFGAQIPVVVAGIVQSPFDLASQAADPFVLEDADGYDLIYSDPSSTVNGTIDWTLSKRIVGYWSVTGKRDVIIYDDRPEGTENYLENATASAGLVAITGVQLRVQYNCLVTAGLRDTWVVVLPGLLPVTVTLVKSCFVCRQECEPPYGHGQCNYSAQRCDCEAGWYGQDDLSCEFQFQVQPNPACPYETLDFSWNFPRNGSLDGHPLQGWASDWWAMYAEGEWGDDYLLEGQLVWRYFSSWTETPYYDESQFVPTSVQPLPNVLTPGTYLIRVYSHDLYVVLTKYYLTVRPYSECGGFDCMADSQCGGGTCNNGVCTCPPGYWGNACTNGCDGEVTLSTFSGALANDRSLTADDITATNLSDSLRYSAPSNCVWIIEPDPATYTFYSANDTYTTVDNPNGYDVIRFEPLFFSLFGLDTLYFDAWDDSLEDWVQSNSLAGRGGATIEIAARSARLRFETADINPGRGFALSFSAAFKEVISPQPLGVGPIVGIVLACIIPTAILIVLLVWWRLRKESDAPVEPNYVDLFASEDFKARLQADIILFPYDAEFKKKGKKKMELFLNSLTDPSLWPTMPLALLEYGYKIDELAEDLVILLDAKKATDLFGLLLEAELKKVKTARTLLKERTLFVRCAEVYLKLHGLPWLWQTLGAAYWELASNYNNEEQIEEFDEQITFSMNSDVQVAATKLLDLLFTSAIDFPDVLRAFLSLAVVETDKRFEGVEHLTVARILFLRFLVPAVTAPAQYGLYPKPLGPLTQHKMNLLGQVLVAFASKTAVADKDCLAFVNQLLQENSERLDRFYDQISTFTESEQLDKKKKKRFSLPQTLVHDSARRLYYPALADPKHFRNAMTVLLKETATRVSVSHSDFDEAS